MPAGRVLLRMKRDYITHENCADETKKKCTYKEIRFSVSWDLSKYKSENKWFKPKIKTIKVQFAVMNLL